MELFTHEREVLHETCISPSSGQHQAALTIATCASLSILKAYQDRRLTFFL